MPFLSEVDQEQLQEIFSTQLDQPVRMRAFTKPTSKLYIPGQELCASCEDAEPFVRELAALSDKLEAVVHDVQAEPAIAEQYSIDGMLPALVLERVTQVDAEDSDSPQHGAVRFLGLPAGYEFSTLVADIVDLSTSAVSLSDATQTELRALEQVLQLQVFVTPT